jgi:hypothetical protein
VFRDKRPYFHRAANCKTGSRHTNSHTTTTTTSIYIILLGLMMMMMIIIIIITTYSPDTRRIKLQTNTRISPASVQSNSSHNFESGIK